MAQRDASRGDSVATSTQTHSLERHFSNLPLELTSFVGREREIAEVEGLLTEHRLLTLTGPGGCGKTRLALAVASGLADGFEDGVWWVGLASLSDPDLVPQAVASALDVRETPGRSFVEALAEHLRSKKVLLVLDNCEHLVASCAALADTLLHSCPNLRVLATSREALGLAGEIAWLVPPLSLPDTSRLPDPGTLIRYEAVRLFVERAKAGVSTFALTPKKAPAVARLCRQLDGMPLAIELAAARVRVLSVEQISARLDDCFRLLKTDGRMALPRHQTLRATIDWSYDLLSEKEKVLFRRVSVFAGGFTLEVAERVCAGEGIEEDEVLDLLSHLVDKSLVLATEQGGEARYRMLETVRQYGRQKLQQSGEEAKVREAHAGFFLELVERAEPVLQGPEQAGWLERLEREHDNLRAALGWLGEEGEAERGLRFAGALLRFWWFRGHLTEGRAQLEALLDLPGASRGTAARAKALHTLGVLIYRHTDYVSGDWVVARSRLEESLKIYRRLGDEPRIAAVLQDLGRLSAEFGEWSAAHSFLEESLEIGHRLGDRHGIALSQLHLGAAHLFRADLSPARAHLEKGLDIFRELDDKFWIGASLVFLGYIACEEGDRAAARARFVEMDELISLVQVPWGATYALEGFARLAAAEGQAARALRLGGATAALRRRFGVSIGPALQAAFRRSMEPAWRAMSEQEGETVWEEGRSMTLEQAVGYALEPTPEAERSDDLGAEDSSENKASLSARELEVLRLVAEGLTDGQVAEQLYLSPRTVNAHLRSVYRKLGVGSRAAAVKRADGLGLI